jgi:hypothetical protein
MTQKATQTNRKPPNHPVQDREEKPQHFGDGEDHLTMRDIQKKFLPHPLAPLLTSFGMARGTESANFNRLAELALWIEGHIC